MCVLLIELPKTTNTRRDRVAKLVGLSGGTPLVALHTSHYFTAQTPPISAMSPMPCAKVTRETLAVSHNWNSERAHNPPWEVKAVLYYCCIQISLMLSRSSEPFLPNCSYHHPLRLLRLHGFRSPILNVSVDRALCASFQQIHFVFMPIASASRATQAVAS